LRQAAGDLFWKRSGEPERSVDSRRQLPDADDFPSLPAELAIDALIAGHVALALFIPEGAVGFRAGVALGAAVPEPSLWEQTRETTEGSPKGVATFAGKQMPSTIRRRRWRPSVWEPEAQPQLRLGGIALRQIDRLSDQLIIKVGLSV
jgi:hypothetical protein